MWGGQIIINYNAIHYDTTNHILKKCQWAESTNSDTKSTKAEHERLHKDSFYCTGVPNKLETLIPEMKGDDTVKLCMPFTSKHAIYSKSNSQGKVTNKNSKMLD